jgi:Tol biopolymer transport system component
MKRFRRSWGRVAIALMLGISLLGCHHSTNTFNITPPTQPLNNSLNTNKAENNPQLSYDGRYLVFASDRRNTRGIYLYDVQRRQLVPLPQLNQLGSWRDEPDVSADGRYIVYIAETEGKPDVFLYDRMAQRNQNLTINQLGAVRHPTISGNGRFVAFERERNGQWDIEIRDRGITIDPAIQPEATPE